MVVRDREGRALVGALLALAVVAGCTGRAGAEPVSTRTSASMTSAAPWPAESSAAAPSLTTCPVSPTLAPAVAAQTPMQAIVPPQISFAPTAPARTDTAGPTPLFLTVQNLQTADAGMIIAARRLSDGTVDECLAAVTAEHSDPMLAPDGSVLVLSTFSCLSRLDRIDTRTRAHAVLKQFQGDAAWGSLSPDGTRLAVLATTNCIPHCRVGGCGLDELKIIDLATWHTVSATIKRPYYGLASSSWSPDGSRLALEIGGVDGTFVTVDAAHPDFSQRRTVMRPPHCTFSSPAWTRSGIFVALRCRSTNALALVDPTGIITQRWPLPACGGVHHFEVLPGARTALVQVDTGYGSDGPCGGAWSTQIWQVDPPTVRTISASHHSEQAAGDPQLAGF